MAKTEKFLCKKEIAAKYKISVKTLARILKKHSTEIGEPYGYSYSPIQIGKIKNLIGEFDTI
jgi:hypothetical protein